MTSPQYGFHVLENLLKTRLDVEVAGHVPDSHVQYVGRIGHLETARWLIGREPVLFHVRVWSTARDAWIQAVARSSCYWRKA